MDQGESNGKRLATAAEAIIAYLGSPAGRGRSSQLAISDATGVPRSHVPRELKKLKDAGLVEERKGHVAGGVRQVKCYGLTEAGARSFGELKGRLAGDTIEMRVAGESSLVPLGELLKELPLHEIMRQARETGFVTVGPVEESENGAAGDGFIGRNAELGMLAKWYRSKGGAVMVLYGGPGQGKSALVRRFIEANRLERKAFWFDMESFGSPSAIVAAVRGRFGAGGEGGEPLAGLSMPPGALLVFDGYDGSDEAIVDLFSRLASGILEFENLKMIVTALDTTPFYGRFYRRGSTHVAEMLLKGLDVEDAGRILGGCLAQDALKQIYLITKGKPGALRALADGDQAALRDVTRLTAEEIRLLMFLRTVKG